MNETGIYKIEQVSTGKVYVGSATNIHRRWNDHRRYLREGRHQNRKLQLAWGKHGANDFIFSVLETCGRLILLEREQHWIDELKAAISGFNINPTAGSNLGVIFHKEWRDKLSEVARRPRPTQSKAILEWWSRQPSKRVSVVCCDCGKERRMVISAANKVDTATYRCRSCYLAHKTLIATGRTMITVACMVCDAPLLRRPKRSENPYCMSCARAGEKSGHWETGTMLTLSNETLPLSVWARRLGLRRGTITERLRRGDSDARALRPLRGTSP